MGSTHPTFHVKHSAARVARKAGRPTSDARPYTDASRCGHMVAELGAWMAVYITPEYPALR